MTNKKHQSFKLFLLGGIFVILIICLVVLIILDVPKNEQSSEEIQAELIQKYFFQAKEILNTFLIDRKKDEFSESDFCQQTVETTVSQILNLTVPVDYKEFHLKSVILLDQEMKNCEEKNEKVSQDLDKKWEELVNQL